MPRTTRSLSGLTLPFIPLEQFVLIAFLFRLSAFEHFFFSSFLRLWCLHRRAFSFHFRSNGTFVVRGDLQGNVRPAREQNEAARMNGNQPSLVKKQRPLGIFLLKRSRLIALPLDSVTYSLHHPRPLCSILLKRNHDSQSHNAPSCSSTRNASSL